MTEGEPVSYLWISIAGNADVRRQGKRIGELTPGHVIGTALALSGEPSPIEASFSEAARYMRWSLPSLRRFLDQRPDLRLTLQGLVNRDLAGKLESLLSS
jgi:CRP-like cAMP-binding protein